MIPQVIAYYDYLLLLPYGLVFFLLARRFAKRNSSSTREFYGLLISWWIKMVACILYAWMIVYYYRYGDPLAYKDRSDELYYSILKNWGNVKYAFLPVEAFRDFIASRGYSSYQYLTIEFAYYTESTFFTSRISCLVAFFTLNRFLLVSFVFTNIAYFGFIIIYRTLKKIIKGCNKELAIACLFVPSCVFWSSALAKEPLCVISLAFIFSCSVKMFFEKKLTLPGILTLIFYSYVLITVKDYIFFSFLFAFICWLVYDRLRWFLAKNLLTRIYFLIFSLGAFAIIARYYSNQVFLIVAESLGGIISSNISMYESMASATEGGGSFIQVNNVDFSSPAGILKFVPEGLVTVFFRPFPWEILNVLMIFTVLENLFFIYLLCRVFIKSRFFTRQIFLNRNYQVFAILFTIIMALIISVSTFNFGSMVRYKMPFLPFWASLLLVLNKKLSGNKRVVNL